MGKGGTSTAEVQEYLGGLDYPADRNKLVDFAKGKNAPQEVVEVLSRIPEKSYPTPIEVNEEIGKLEQY